MSSKTKVLVRKLPPGLTEEGFLKAVAGKLDPARYDWFSFFAGKERQEAVPRHVCACALLGGTGSVTDSLPSQCPPRRPIQQTCQHIGVRVAAPTAFPASVHLA